MVLKVLKGLGRMSEGFWDHMTRLIRKTINTLIERAFAFRSDSSDYRSDI